jgi:hypothetical protein
MGGHMTVDPETPKRSRLEEYLDELKENVKDPIHLRLLKAYQGIDPVDSMEVELGKILLEVLKSEN